MTCIVMVALRRHVGCASPRDGEGRTGVELSRTLLVRCSVHRPLSRFAFAKLGSGWHGTVMMEQQSSGSSKTQDAVHGGQVLTRSEGGGHGMFDCTGWKPLRAGKRFGHGSESAEQSRAEQQVWRGRVLLPAGKTGSFRGHDYSSVTVPSKDSKRRTIAGTSSLFFSSAPGQSAHA